ncbi:hypothetical protein ONZ45_g15654 [Pleurotus djamor]|nr:hypothetical protein ONZ45_g15654 [Pleurotus djamor]
MGAYYCPELYTFDGTSTKKQSAFYTAHATTPDRVSYLLDGLYGSRERHTSDWIKDKLLAVIREIGEPQWAATCSDNTSTTKACRRKTVTEVPAIFDLPDCVHHLQLLIGDITKLDEFKTPMNHLKKIIRHFSKSGLSVEHLLDARRLEGESARRLTKIGKTRFSTHWSAVQSVEPCLHTIRDLVTAKSITFKSNVLQEMFSGFDIKSRAAFSSMELRLLQYSRLVELFARSSWSLEAAHANASDVFVFWLAAGATLKSIIDQPTSRYGIEHAFAQDVMACFNFRYEQFFAGRDLYLTAFVLDPRYKKPDFLKPSTPSDDPDLKDIPYPDVYQRVAKFLKDMLHSIINTVKKYPEARKPPLFEEMSAKKIAMSFREQFNSFWAGYHLFSCPLRDCDSLEWWQSLTSDSGSNVLAMLAVRIFSVLVNSMPDERTNSHITWFNSPLRGNQKAETLIDMVQIGQYYRNKDGKKGSTARRPAVKFRAIEKDLVTQLAKGDEDVDITQTDDEDESDVEVEESPLRIRINQRRDMDITVDDAINLHSKALLDMISTEELIPTGNPAPAKPTNDVFTVDDDDDINWDDV